MMLYTGSGGFRQLDIAILGDGEGKVITIDLKKPPLALSFAGAFPVDARVSVVDGPSPQVTLHPQGRLQFEFQEPLPPPSSTMGDLPGMSPRSQLTVYLLYAGEQGKKHGSATKSA